MILIGKKIIPESISEIKQDLNNFIDSNKDNIKLVEDLDFSNYQDNIYQEIKTKLSNINQNKQIETNIQIFKELLDEIHKNIRVVTDKLKVIVDDITLKDIPIISYLNIEDLFEKLTSLKAYEQRKFCDALLERYGLGRYRHTLIEAYKKDLDNLIKLKRLYEKSNRKRRFII